MREFAERYPHDSNPANILRTSSLDNFPDEAIAKSLANLNRQLRGKEEALPSNSPNNAGGNNDKLAIVRQQQLERTVENLLTRVEQMDTEMKKKDGKIKAFEDYIRKAKEKKAASIAVAGDPVGNGPSSDSIDMGSSSLKSHNGKVLLPGANAVTIPVIESKRVPRPISSQAKADAIQRNLSGLNLNASASPRAITSTIRDSKQFFNTNNSNSNK